MESDEQGKKQRLDKAIKFFAEQLPDTSRTVTDLKKFADFHDRRCYDMIRRCYSPESSYSAVVEAIRTIHKRLQTAPETKISTAAAASVLETLTPILYRTALLIYNKSHIPIIVEISRSDQNSLGASAHEFLKEMAQSNPGIFKAHVKTMCELIVEMAPVVKKGKAQAAEHDDESTMSIIDTIKACSGFSKQYPKEMPKDRALMDACINFALYSTNATAAKYAVTIIMQTSSRKEMYASDLLKKILKEWSHDSEYALARLSTLSQLMLLVVNEMEVDPEKLEKVLDIAIKEILLKVQNPVAPDAEQEDWDGTSQPDAEVHAKFLAINILVNRLRAHAEDADGDSERKVLSEAPFRILNALLANDGELSKAQDTPKAHRTLLRLHAAKMLLKLGRLKGYEQLITPVMFNRLGLTAQDASFSVRQQFVERLKKYLVTGMLPPRYYTIIFLLAFEPQVDMKDETMTWLRARARQMRDLGTAGGQLVMETVFARLLSLLAHHPDFGTTPEDLSDTAGYLVFYLQAVSTEDNLGCIYYVAQRLKNLRDAIDVTKSEVCTSTSCVSVYRSTVT